MTNYYLPVEISHEKLKSCPFCGGKSDLYFDDHSVFHARYLVVCEDCEASTGSAFFDIAFVNGWVNFLKPAGIYKDFCLQAIKNWQHRKEKKS